METKDKEQWIIPLEGVESEHCANIVANGLSEWMSTDQFQIEINNKRVVLNGSEPGAIAKTVEVIKGLGYGVPTIQQKIPVLHMTCASCAISVESILKSSAGVLNASVNYADASVQVEYVAPIATKESLRKTVQGIGYDLFIDDTANEEEALEEIEKERFKQLKIKTIGSILFSIPVVIIGMFFMDLPYGNYIMLVLTSPVLFYFGKDFHKNAWKQLKNKSANMDTLVSLSTLVAFIFSLFNTFFPHFWHSRGLMPHVYYEAASVIIAFILLGKILEERAKGNTSSAIKKLMGLKPKTVTLVQANGEEHVVSIEKVEVGHVLRIKPGEQIAVDGTVLDGTSYVNESMMSGEPVPVHKESGDKVFAGTLNQKGSFLFKADKVGTDTMLSQIIQMVQKAQGSKAPVQKLVDKIAGIFVPAVISIALISMISWVILGGDNGFTQGLLSMVTVLVIACPCALGLATPTAIMVGIGKGAENGILIKDAESLQFAQKMNAIILDKTGTITEGKPMVVEEVWLDKNPELKSILFSIEKSSEHPLAEALVDYFKQTELVNLDAFESLTGRGVVAQYKGSSFAAGNPRLMKELGIEIDGAFQSIAQVNKASQNTQIWFAKDQQVVAMFGIADTVKESSRQAIQELKDLGVDVYMLTGDNKQSAEAVAKEVGITEFFAELLPEDKSKFVEKLQKEGKVVGMVGDGINDSSALAQADISIAMGKGSDIAMDVAKMTIISSDLLKVATAVRLSKKTVAAIKQNLFWAFIYNLIGIPIAAGLLYPFNGFLLNPMIAGAAMALSSVSVVMNSLRLKYTK